MGWSRSLAIEDTVQGIQNFQKWRSFFESDPNCDLSLESFRSGFLGGGFTYFFYVDPYLEKIPILTPIFQMGRFNHQPVFVGWDLKA